LAAAGGRRPLLEDPAEDRGKAKKQRSKGKARCVAKPFCSVIASY